MAETKLYFGNDNSIPVNVPTDVRDHLPPNRQYQFAPGHSMALAAESWINARGMLPREIARVIGSDVLISAHFEYGVTVYGRGASMTDVMAFTPDAVIAVEAKASEILGPLVCDWIDDEQVKNPRSPLHRCAAIIKYGLALKVRFKDLMPLRYQLLHRTLSAAKTARKADRQRAWMIVQSFSSPDSNKY